MKHPLYILGDGGHAQVIAGLLDQNDEFSPVLLDKARNDPPEGLEGECFIVGVGDVGKRGYALRRRLFQGAYAKAMTPTSIVTTPLPKTCRILGGSLILGHISNNVFLGFNCIVNTGAIVEHDCRVGNHVHVATGAILCGGVEVDDCAFIGAGSVVKQGVKIGSEAVVGCGAVVLRDVPPGEVVVGCPASPMRVK